MLFGQFCKLVKIFFNLRLVFVNQISEFNQIENLNINKLNILLLNWTWFPSGGDWTYVNSMFNLYTEKGNKVIPFSCKDNRNFESEYSEYFYDKFDSESKNPLKLRRNINSAGAKLENLIKSNRIDVAHLNNLNHYVTPKFLRILSKHSIPIIITVHDYKFFCSLTTFFRNRQVCEECSGGKFIRCTVNKCKGGKLLPSLYSSIQNYYYNIIRIYNRIDYFICPSEFIRQIFIKNGYDENKLITIYHFYEKEIINNVNKLTNEKSNNKRYITYLGRVEENKGIRTLINAVAELPDVNLTVIGYGNLLKEMKEYCKNKNITNIEFTGNKERKDALYNVMQSKFLVVPSIWYEVFGYTVIEGMLLGKPVIASDSGALPELINNGKNGFIYKSGSVSELKETIMSLYYDDNKINSLGNTAKERAYEITDRDSYYDKIEEVFKRLKVC